VACTAYCGFPGSGKSYEVVTEVIVPALRSGRRVVSNISGLHYEEMRAYLLEEGTTEAAIGSLECVDNERVSAPLFWAQDGRETLVKPGDLVVIDECWRWMSAGGNIPPSMYAFFREHRHFVDAAGVSCDIVLITQAISDLDRKVRVIIEKHFVMEKLKRLGLSKQYSVDVYNKFSSTKANFLRRMLRTYNKKFFCFYTSYDGKGGDEREVDKRINVFRSPGFWMMAALVPVLFGFGAWGTYRLYSKHAEPEKKPETGAVAVEGGKPSAVPAASSAAAGSRGGGSGADESWRVIGYYRSGGTGVFMMQGGERVRFIYAPDSYRVGSLNVEVIVGERLFASYGGAAVPRGIGGIVGAK